MSRGFHSTLAAALVAFGATMANAQQSELTVLYVGPDPENPIVASYVTEQERQRELVVERVPAFRDFLGEHFETVELVMVDDYAPSMSDRFDVTIFDARIRPQSPADGGPTPLPLPRDFDRPALMVGEVGPFMLGRFGPGLKIDHL